MTAPSESVRNSAHSDDITRAAQWLADRKKVDDLLFAPVLPTLKARFGLTDADAAEAILLSGNYSICRRAFS